MPKEYIHNRYFGEHVSDHSECCTDAPMSGGAKDCRLGKSVPIDPSAIKVGWGRDSEHVEMAILKDYGPEGRDGSGDWHTQLDRAGINRLIRTLRKARDAAFGADA